ncbi:hypothetical protein LWI29_030394 [Acer saccharum]|uniref:PGG domain-containing protein n=1 Tax=Acer saccharum TaxID=4024 RepID=A0AA39THI6_ACESA|nr:hypothetical protein LWI29_030394 [Acer saccharum]
MDPQLYDAAVKGNIEPFTARELDSIVTPNKNTILHINIRSRNRSSMETASTKFVEDILDRCPSLLLQVNAKAETPLHVAAKYGHSDMVEVLIKSSAKPQHEELESGRGAAKRMLIRMTNNEGDTALHEAVKYKHLDVVKILTREDPDFSYSSNKRGQTPLYIAAAAVKFYPTAKKSLEIVVEILETCTSPAYEGPDQMTALHAAAAARNENRLVLDITRKILEKKKSLIKERDRYGWTPLHYAAYHRNRESMETLLECDISTAYIGDKHRKMTPLHLAIGQGYIPREIISRCPDCCEFVDERRWNVLHFAVLSLSDKNLKTLLKEYPLIRNLINDKDVDGNTPLHLLATFHRGLLWEIMEDIDEDIFLDLDIVNNQNMSVHGMMRKSDHGQLEQEILKLEGPSGPYQRGVVKVRKGYDEFDEKVKKEYEKVKESHLIVAALIATVTFTAAFTLPGGVIQDEGTAILSKKAAFQAFVITDAIAMVLSLSAVFAYSLLSVQIVMATSEKSFLLLAYGGLSTVMAMGAMTSYRSPLVDIKDDNDVKFLLCEDRIIPQVGVTLVKKVDQHLEARGADVHDVQPPVPPTYVKPTHFASASEGNQVFGSVPATQPSQCTSTVQSTEIGEGCPTYYSDDQALSHLTKNLLMGVRSMIFSPIWNMIVVLIA